MSHAIRSEEVVRSLIQTIDVFQRLDGNIDFSLSPTGYFYTPPTEAQIAASKAEFEASYKQLSTGNFDEDRLGQLFKDVDNLTKTGKSPIKEGVAKKGEALKVLTTRVASKIENYTTLFAKSQEIKDLSQKIRETYFSTVTEIVELQGRVTVLQGQVQARPQDFIQVQKDVVLEMSFNVNEIYDSAVSRELRDLYDVLSGRTLYRARGNLDDAPPKTDQKSQTIEVLAGLPQSIQGAIYGQVYRLSSGDRQGADWGKEHALDNFVVLKKAVLEVIKKEAPQLARDIAEEAAHRPPEFSFKILLKQDEKSNTPDEGMPVVALTPMQFSINEAIERLMQNKDAAVAEEQLKALDEPTRNAIYTRVWEKAGKPMGNPNFGRDNATKDLDRLESILQDLFAEGFSEAYQREEMRAFFDFTAKEKAKIADSLKALD